MGQLQEAPQVARASGDYRAYRTLPFTSGERDTVEILFGGVNWRAERIIQSVFDSLGYRTRLLSAATRNDLITGRELADVGQCCPTSFVGGSLVNFLQSQAEAIDVSKQFVFLTPGGCGPCRFGQYHQSYELALHNIGLDAFRIFVLAQDGVQHHGVGGGIDFDLPMTIGWIWAILLADVVQDLEYQTRPYEREAGQTDAVVADCIALLCETMRTRPRRSGRWSTLAWYVSTGYFSKALGEVFRRFGAIAVDRLQPKPLVKITGEFYLETVEGEPNHNIHRWLEAQGAEVYPAPVAVWLDFLLRCQVQHLEPYLGIDRMVRARILAIKSLQRLFRWSYDRLRRALGGIPRPLPDQYELRRLAAPYFHHQLDSGEGDMPIGKALWTHLHKKAHMVCELSPYGCLPCTMSIGAMAAVLGRYPDLLYAPLEITGDGEIHVLSRCQMVLNEAKKRARSELDQALARSGLSLDAARARLAAGALGRATGRVGAHGYVGTAANALASLGGPGP